MSAIGIPAPRDPCKVSYMQDRGRTDVERDRAPGTPTLGPTAPDSRALEDLEVAGPDRMAIESVIEGKPDVVRTAITVLLAEGHLLIEDVPGRRQDHARQGAGPLDRLLRAPGAVHPRPAAQRHHRRQRLQPGRARLRVPARARSSPTSWSATRSTAPRPRPSPRCWSAWRRARSPSTARPTRSQAPFMVMATQNPIEMEGTYPLPEAQRDRFMARISMGYPSAARRAGHARQPRRRVPAGATCSRSPTRDTVAELIEAVRARLRSATAVKQYVVDLADRDPVDSRRCGWAPRRAPRCTCCAPPGPTPRWRAATTCCPTTCSSSPCRCSPTGSSPPARPSWPGARTADVLHDLVRRVPVRST